MPVQFKFLKASHLGHLKVFLSGILRTRVDVSSALPEAEFSGLVTYPPVLHLIEEKDTYIETYSTDIIFYIHI